MQLKIKARMLVDEALVGVQLTDRIKVPTSRTITDSGQMHVPCKFARTGSQLYTAKQLGIVDAEPNAMITVWRDEKDVFDEASIDSFRSSPVTIGHPLNDEGKPMPVTSANAKSLQVGMLEGMPVRDEDTLGGTLILSAQEAIDAVESGTQELSAGYVCDIEMVDGKYYQRNIRANHIAIVAKGRAGSSCRVSDEAAELETPEGNLVLLVDELEASKVSVGLLTDQLAASVKLVADMEAGALEKAGLVETEMSQLKLDLADAKVAAEEGVVERCSAIENARLIADMRDLGDKTVAQIERMVVEDQMPQLKLDGKTDTYISAMFEILVDASKSETPMSKLLGKQSLADTTNVVSKPVDKVALARQASIERNKK